VEWRPTDKQQREHVEPEGAVEWLTGVQGVSADWIFVGRLLHRHEDSETLSEPAHLKAIMETVFEGFKDPWRQANLLGTAR
jgi:hypothetical protein